MRIADASRVRLGAHLAEGTTVMHEGFVNYNAGTLGASMVEGRISAGVVVDDGSDVGGGASIMGTLSGGGKERIRVGRRCLIGANAGIGISLGDDCVVEAGTYVTAGSKITMPDGSVVKASDAVRTAGPAVLAQQRHRWPGGQAAHRGRRRTQRSAARQRLIQNDLMPNRARRGLFVVIVVVVVAVVGALGLRALWNAATSSDLFSGCTVGSYSLTTDQAAIASTMVGVATRRNLPERAAVLALAAGTAGEQAAESADQLGRPRLGGRAAAAAVAGLGHCGPLNDVHYATGAFLDALVKLPGWQEQPLPRRCRPYRSRPTAARTPSTRARPRPWPTP